LFAVTDSNRRERRGEYRLRVPRGRLITIEGLDGAGKTTLVDALGAEIARHAVTVSLLREPGGVPLAERIRELLRDSSGPGAPSARAEALLYAAARAQLADTKLEPLLAEGTWVLLDRFVDSSLAYQGGGRELGVESVRELNRFATGGLIPDRTLYLRLAPDTGRRRQEAREQAPDRMELETPDFFEQVAATYDELAEADPLRIRRIDAEQHADAVLRDALAAIADLLPAGSDT
jgi:dTMP kinase